MFEYDLNNLLESLKNIFINICNNLNENIYNFA